MTWANVQSRGGTISDVASQTVSFSANTVAGHRAILVLQHWNDSSHTGTITGVSDAKNGAWHHDLAAVNYSETGYNGYLEVWSVQLTKQLLSTDSITIAASSTMFSGSPGLGWYALLEYSGLSQQTNPVDVSSSGSNSSPSGTTAPASGSTAATTGASELALIVFSDLSGGASWSAAPTGTARSSNMSSADTDAWIGDKDSGAKGSTISASGTLSTAEDWGMAVVVYALDTTSAALTLPPQPPQAAYPQRPRQPASVPDLPASLLTMPAPPDPSLSQLGPLAPVLRPEMRQPRFDGPFPLADVAELFPAGSPLVLEIVSAQPSGALPKPLQPTLRFLTPAVPLPVFPAGLAPLPGPSSAAFPPRPRQPVTLPDASALLPAGPSLVQEIVSAQPLGALPQALPRLLRVLGPYPLDPLSAALIPAPLLPPSPALTTLGALPQALPRIAPFLGPFPLAPLAPPFLPQSDAHTMPALGALPQALPRLAPFIGPFPLRDVAPLFPPGPPLVLPIITAQPLGTLPRALPLVKPFIGPFALAPLGPSLIPPPPNNAPIVASILSLRGPLPSALLPTFRFLAPATLPDLSAIWARAPQPTPPLIPPALVYAQQTLTSTPIISAVLRARRGLAGRLDPATLYTGATTEVPCAVAAPSNGNVVRARLSGGNVQTQSLAASSGSAWTTWSTLATATAPSSGFGVDLAANGATVAIAYLTAAQAIAVRTSSNNGASWSGATSISCSGVVTDVALAYAPNGDLLVVAGDNGGTIHSYHQPHGGSFGADVTLLPSGSEFVSSIALAYSGADWYALFGWETASVNLIGSAIYGNGGQQSAGAWSTDTDILGIAPGNAASPQVCGFAWGSDGGHAILVEEWAITGGYTSSPCYLMECSSTTEFAGGYWSEPAPFAYNGASGADLAYSQATAGEYVAAGENLVATLAPPADVDVSNRIISFVQHSDWHAGALTLALDNSDGALNALITSRNTVGLRLDLSLGYNTTAGGPLTEPQPWRWVIKAEGSYVASRYIVTITAHDGWQLLHQLIARRQAQFGTSLGLSVRTTDQLIHWLCAKAGILYTAPANTTLNQRTPDWTIQPNQSYGTALLSLLDTIEGWLILTGTGATTIALSSSDTSIYAFGVPNTPGVHPVIQVFHSEELQPANLITVYTGTLGGRPLVLGAQAFDTPDAHLLGAVSHTHNDLQLETANAQLTANSLLRKAQLSVPLHSLSAPPQVAQQLGDVITVTDPITLVAYTGRVQAQTIHFDRDRSTWLHQLTISAV